MNPFESLGLSSGLVEVVKALGFENPTPIQEKAIPELLTGERDFVGLAHTGTGKTAAFGLPIVELVDASQAHPQALVLAPTRELCLQITADMQKFCKKYKPINVVAVYGGASITEQHRQLKKGAHIVVATPGRLIDLSSRKYLRLDEIKILVLDEADEMLNMGFKESIDAILAYTPTTKKTWLFSATMPPAVREISRNYMHDPLELAVSSTTSTNQNIGHHYVLVKESDKYAALKRLLDINPDIFGLVFCRTKLDTQEIAEKLMRDGYNADSLHGDLTQSQRDRVMGKFRDRTLQILIATDVAARGIDVSDITHVIHMNLPDELENYTHRSGRTARAGKSGDSILLLGRREFSRLSQLERSLRTKFSPMQVPTGTDICRQQIRHFLTELKNTEIPDTKEMQALLPEIIAELESMSREDLIRRFSAREFSRLFDYYRNASDLNLGAEKAPNAPGHSVRAIPSPSNTDRYFINLGRKDGLDKGALLRILCDTAGVTKNNVGRIDLNSTHSYFEIESALSRSTFDSFQNVQFKGRKVRLDRIESGNAGQKNNNFKRKPERHKMKMAW
jgi:ATP-dependent RNA helicase DeaD